ncbi:hypothetical protein AB5J55_42960 [Streptomyces sp. R11]|uniref:Uncharacterized protein n=1 Tax=Streptomyces sp. R11 TaxID=3238625 RepID=A0AB39NC79_9ACTN
MAADIWSHRSSSAGRRVGDGCPFRREMSVCLPARPGWHDARMTLPTPCPADLVPEATGLDAYTAVYQQAKRQGAVFVAVECQAQFWTVKVDTLTAGPSYVVDETVMEALRAAVAHLVRSREIRPDSHESVGYVALFDIGSESRACMPPCTETSHY